MKGYHGDIEGLTLGNEKFRQVLYTGKHSQLVLMCLQASEEIGEEVHAGNDQFFRFESGTGKVLIDGNEYSVGSGSVVIIPAGAKHNIINTSSHDTLKMYTIYSPAHHKEGTIHSTKAEAKSDREEFDGVTTE
jgi:mannose-6-phosphate isomerase-like protein (cupin superfamily)